MEEDPPRQPAEKGSPEPGRPHAPMVVDGDVKIANLAAGDIVGRDTIIITKTPLDGFRLPEFIELFQQREAEVLKTT